jgi:hypothetical protein
LPIANTVDLNPMLSGELLALQSFIETTGPRLVGEHIEVELPENLRPQERDIREFVESLVPDVFEQLLEQFHGSFESNNTHRHNAEQSSSSSASATNLNSSIDVNSSGAIVAEATTDSPADPIRLPHEVVGSNGTGDEYLMPSPSGFNGTQGSLLESNSLWPIVASEISFDSSNSNWEPLLRMTYASIANDVPESHLGN